jgi:hypothetical protein
LRRGGRRPPLERRRRAHRSDGRQPRAAIGRTSGDPAGRLGVVAGDLPRGAAGPERDRGGRPAALAAAEELLLVNSVRRWIPATLAVPIADAGDRPEEEQEPAR